MNGPLLDSNVLLDILVRDPVWYPWSSGTVASLLDAGSVFINPIVFAEVSVGFARVEDLEDALPGDLFRRAPLPWEAAFLAGKAFLRYRQSGGSRRSPPPIATGRPTASRRNCRNTGGS